MTAGSIIGNETVDFAQYFDDVGNVTQRNDQVTGRNEVFGYAEGGSNNLLNRLTSFTVTNSSALNKTYSYDAIGNMKSKSDVGDQYIYGAGSAGVHALTSIKNGGTLLRTFAYDANGNMTSDIDSVSSSNNRTMVYGSIEKPLTITKGSSAQIEFRYGTGRERYRRIDNVFENSTAVKIETTYFGGYERVIHTGGVKDGKTEHKYMLGGVALKIDTEESSGTTSSKTRYLHTDHIGSVIAITDESASEIARFRYDPFGKQHTVINQSAITQTPVTKWLDNTQRGFTGHEMLSSVDVIHMNGRTYDANLGRFMQADPYIQAPKNMQNMNRYAYVLNNPLSYTDPSGYFFKDLLRSISKVEGLGTVITIALNFVPGCQVWCAAVFNAATTFAVTGSLRSAAIGFAAAAISSGGVLTSAVVGGVSARMQGGNFGRGFAAAGIGAAIGGGQGINNPVQRVIVAAVVGGTISEITGGKFANGAITAAFAAALAADWSSLTNVKDNRGFYYGDDITSSEEKAAGDRFLKATEKNPPNSLKINTTSVLGIKGTKKSDHPDIVKAIEDRLEKQKAFLEKKGLPLKLSKVQKLYILIDETESGKYGSWGKAPISKNGHRALTIYTQAFKGLKGQALVEEIGNTIGHELGHSFMKLRGGISEDIDHRRIEAFGKWLNKEAK